MNERKWTDVLKKDVLLHSRICRYPPFIACVKHIVYGSNNTTNFCITRPVDPKMWLRGAHMSRGKWGSTALWGTPPTPISEKAFNLLKLMNAPRQHYIIRNKFWKWTEECIVNIFSNSVIFILRCLTVRFTAYLRATENENGPQKHQEVLFVTIVIKCRDLSCLYSCSFSYQSTM